MINKLCVISSYYPSETDPYYVFVGELIEQFADMGIECHVISPVSNMEKKHRGITRVERTKNGSIIHVYCPPFTVFPSRSIFGWKTYRLTVESKRKAILKVYRECVKDCDAIYSHFIESGVQAALLSNNIGKPAFVAVGESVITAKKLDYTLYKNILHTQIKGVIAVSTELKNQIYEEDIFPRDVPLAVFPNGIDLTIFYPRGRKLCRDKLGIKDEDYVISFVGGFIKRKGLDLLQQAVARHKEWKCILIGSGDLQVTLEQEQIVFCGRVSHDKIPDYICAADVFVLPTKAEGCCNAIIEALACGLPVVSSDRDFNYDILPKEYSLLVNPDSVDEIEDALCKLYEDTKLRTAFSERSIDAGRELSIVTRAHKIKEFMENNQ